MLLTFSAHTDAYAWLTTSCKFRSGPCGPQLRRNELGSSTLQLMNFIAWNLDALNNAVSGVCFVCNFVTGVRMMRSHSGQTTPCTMHWCNPAHHQKSSVTLCLWSLARSEPSADYAHALQSLTYGPVKNWKRPPDRPRTTWLPAVESDLQPANVGLYMEAIHEDSHAPRRGMLMVMMIACTVHSCDNLWWFTERQKCHLQHMW